MTDMRTDMKEIISSLHARHLDGLPIESAIGELKTKGLLIGEAILAISLAYEVGHGKAKNAVSSHPDWMEIAAASRHLQDAAADALLLEDSGES